MLRIRWFRTSAFVFTLFGVGSVAMVGRSAPETTGGRMKAAAEAFLAALTPELKKKAMFAFDDPHRLKWFFTPQQDKNKNFTRKGVRLEEMTAEQKQAAMALLRSGLSARGYEQAVTIIGLEKLLRELEGPHGAMVRNDGWYFVSIFGEPSNTGKWGWRFEGHHLSVNYTLDKGEVIAGSPLLLAANPAEIKAGDRKGHRTLPEIENHARTLIRSFTPEQDRIAKQAKHFPEIREGQPTADVGAPVGLTVDRLTAEQQTTLNQLLEAYTARMPEDLATYEMKLVQSTPREKLYFAYSGSANPGEAYTYRIQGPQFVVEFLNVQADSAKNPANHIHSAWRRLPRDFGLTE